MKLIESKTLGTAQASIEFTSIPQDGTDLVLLISARSSQSFTGDNLYISFNGTTTDYSRRQLRGNGSSASSASDEPRRFAVYPGNSSTSNTFGNATLYIPNYTSNVAKSYSSDSVGENNATLAEQSIIAGLWNRTDAITSITISDDDGGNLVAGSTISLYKITKGSDGIVTTS
jgi:hypothetical protein